MESVNLFVCLFVSYSGYRSFEYRFGDPLENIYSRIFLAALSHSMIASFHVLPYLLFAIDLSLYMKQKSGQKCAFMF
jgi:hypothetical protein